MDTEEIFLAKTLNKIKLKIYVLIYTILYSANIFIYIF